MKSVYLLFLFVGVLVGCSSSGNKQSSSEAAIVNDVDSISQWPHSMPIRHTLLLQPSAILARVSRELKLIGLQVIILQANCVDMGLS